MNYTPFHVHTDISLLDSCSKFQEYVDKAVEYGMKSIGFTEHGTIGLWVEKKMYCEKKGLKYIHGMEVYLTEQIETQVRDNYHTILLAKNFDGVREINSLIEVSSRPDHKYYKDRITFDEFLALSDNVIKISACLQSPLNKLDEANPYYERLLQHYDYYEIQPHITKDKIQENYNKKLYELSMKYNKPLIATNDAHYATFYKGECRSILQLAKGIDYEDEDTFDLCFKNYDDFVQAFLNQDALPKEVLMQAIENTNIMADSIEEFKLDLTPKYLKLYENDEQEYMNRIYRMFKDKVQRGLIKQTKEYVDQLKEEVRVLTKLNMMGFMLFMSELISWCHENNIPTGFCRGSVGGSLVAYVTDIIDVNPMRWKTVFSRFANEDRVELGDIDVDFSPDQREMVYNYIINRVGLENTGYISTVGTVADKGAIDEIGRALSRKWMKDRTGKDEILNKLKNSLNELKDKDNPMANDLYGIWATEECISRRYHEIYDKENPYSLDNMSLIKTEYEQNPEATKRKYPEIFYYFDGLVGTAISKGIHPAGMVASNNPLSPDYGVYWSDGKRVLSINMEEVHEVSLIKYDILALNNIQIIRETCKLAGIPYPSSHEINWDDDGVWDDMIKSPAGLFQFSSDYAFDCLKKFSPRIINDMSLVNAALRPSGATYREDLFANRPHKNPSPIIDELLKENRGYLVFQEDTIKFLKEICGLSGSEADNIRRAIGRKQKDRLEKAMPRILDGFCEKSSEPREIAEEQAKQFLQIIEDSSNYQFGYNHSVGYSMIGYLCAYLRYHYPVEFVTAYLNNVDTMEDTKTGIELAKIKGITIENIKYGYSIDKYTFNKATNTIYKGIASIKYCNANIALELKEIADKHKFNDFLELLTYIIENTSVNKKQIRILTVLGFFREFGENKYLLEIIDLHEKLWGKKQLSKDKLESFGLSIDLVKEFSAKETEKLFKDIDMNGLLRNCIKKIPNKPLNVKMQMKYEMEYLEYITYINEQVPKNVYFVTEFKTYKNKSTPYLKVYRINDGETIKTKITRGSMYEEQPFKEYAVLMDVEFRESYKRKFIDGAFVTTDEVELIIDKYSVLG